MPKSCGSNKIRRKSYRKKSYTRADGVKVKAATVPSSCVKDMGKPGKTRKASRVLPKPSGKVHLSHYGYTVDNTEEKRHKSLRDAAREVGTLVALRHLNLLRNYQATESVKNTMASDVLYLSKLHSKSKRALSRSSSKGSRKGSKKSRKGSKKSSRKGSRKSRKGSRKSRKGSKKSKKGSKKSRK